MALSVVPSVLGRGMRGVAVVGVSQQVSFPLSFSIFHCFFVSLFLCFFVSLFLCFFVSLVSLFHAFLVLVSLLLSQFLLFFRAF